MPLKEKYDTLNHWLDRYAYDKQFNLTADNFLKKSNIQTFLKNNLINNRVAMNFYSFVEEYEEGKAYNTNDKVKITEKEVIDDVEYEQNVSIWISKTDNNTQKPSFENRAYWFGLSPKEMSRYISNDTIIATILAAVHKMPRLAGLYPEKIAYTILGVIILAELYYTTCNTTDTGNGIGDSLLTGKSMHNLSYSVRVPEYKLSAEMAPFNTPFGQIALNYILPLIRRPFTISSRYAMF